MSTTSSTPVVLTRRRSRVIARLADYVELTKPGIALMVLITVAAGAFVASWGQPDPIRLLHTLLGTALVAASASALNHLMESASDALMDRTRNRPLPAGRLSRREVIVFASITIVLGLGHLAFWVGWSAAFFGLATWVVYVWIYTPMKRLTWWNTAVGAVSGALPVLIGAASEGRWGVPLILFAIMFFWQFPHFMAIAWIYRKQYARAGMQMLPVVDPSGQRAGIQAVLAALALLPISFLPALYYVPAAGSLYVLVAFLLGTMQLACAIRFMERLDDTSARRLLRASLVYLPSMMLLLMALPLI